MGPGAFFALAVVGVGAAASWASSPAFRSADVAIVKPPPIDLPAIDQLLLRDVAPDEAQIINSKVPVAPVPVVAAKPFTLPGALQSDRKQALECLTSAIYYEAASESSEGQRAVAQVILNRARHSAFPANICGVVFQGSTRPTGCQFSFTCDGSFMRRPGSANWHRARKIADEALSGTVFAPVGLATHYHASYVVPYWASSLAKTAVIGSHIFYRWPGQWGLASAFQKRYMGGEPDAARLQATALAAELAMATSASAIATLDGNVTIASRAELLASVEAKVKAARARLGARHPEMVALQKQRRALAGSFDVSPAAQLNAIEARLTTARTSLGARHPEIVELERRRAALLSSRSRG